MITSLEKFPLTRIHVSRGFIFACMQAANEFEEQRTRFFNENEARDDYMEVHEGMDLTEVAVLDDLLCFNSSCPPWFLHPLVFWICSILILSWPLRIFAEWKTALLNYQVTKLFGTSYLSPSSINYTGPLTRTSTMETVELEAALRREQYFVVPSYSEAMLAQPQGEANVTLVNPCERRIFSRAITTNNEPIILRNYGAIEDELASLPEIQRLRRPLSNSRSMNFLQGIRRNSLSYSLGSRATPMLPSRSVPPRSLSIAGLSNWSNGYHVIGDSPSSDHVPLLELTDDPPPPYEASFLKAIANLILVYFFNVRDKVKFHRESLLMCKYKGVITLNTMAFATIGASFVTCDV
uniref:Transmembrane protein n=1 Tax=Heterorhabditis bacteriophora TaxID=37862 RepID=A0A1I7WFF9_HETBA